MVSLIMVIIFLGIVLLGASKINPNWYDPEGNKGPED